MLRALLLAPPGAGKGTQGTRLAKHYGVDHLAAGDMLRREVATGTPVGLDAQAYMERGELVPDHLVVELVRRRVVGPPLLDGYVLDGFPRTLAQAEEAYRWAADNDRTFHAVILLDVPEEELVERLLARGRETGRTDDTETTVRNRLRVYATNTEPLIEYYRRREILIPIAGTGSVDEVAARIEHALRPLGVPTGGASG
jgi:adenylate kinase